MQSSIIDFIGKNKVATVCFVDKNTQPYCINCFYSFNEEHGILIFKSSYGTGHDVLSFPDKKVAGTILPSGLSLAKISGMQFSGKTMTGEESENLKLGFQYAKQYPLSLTLPGYIWAVKLEFIKFTNNTVGFGNKVIWNLNEDSPIKAEENL